jgi:tRNA dimethylallyltransferase
MVKNPKSSGLKMQFPDLPAPLIVVVGPTGVGKSAFAIELAERVNGEIVSADSRLFYRGMDIGTAKPSREQQARVPHHLVDVAAPDEPWSLVVFQERARQAIEDIQGRGRMPILVGGTGQYILAVIEGWQAPMLEPDMQLRAVLEGWGREIGASQLFQRLRLLDPKAASHIEPNNLRRTVRALEVIFKTGEKFSEQRTKRPSLYSLCRIGLILPRSDLYARIDGRIEQMIQDGFINEVKSLLEKGYSPDLSTFSAIGYREMIRVLVGQISMDVAIISMKRLSRQYVRRQANWFKEKDPSIHWLSASSRAIEEALDLIQSVENWIQKPDTKVP